MQWEKVTANEIINAMDNRYETVRRGNKLGKIVGGRLYRDNLSHRFDTWEFETNKSFNRERIENIFQMLKNKNEYGYIIRAKGIFKDTEGHWFRFDFIPGDITFEEFSEGTTNSVCIIGSKLNKNNVSQLFA
ncbi:GTP-binding protein [Clostridium magnum]|uniref:CobW C-terminal domain-containing protein n=1 Tax=Clostridium magnum DSM 2767 TaxID=1121326 RepID=A0A162R672_9CLOT|nr:GTP-binding protein [Clostridium magnum]KZL89490.1 hypothetical protein CLMAG_49790 [Clostridium magnum DSM 2767]SHH70355.1 Cobalamin synthesis protein cobW C-terminal domain-containing protein [Clostridium magnum DSM 2767]